MNDPLRWFEDDGDSKPSVERWEWVRAQPLFAKKDCKKILKNRKGSLGNLFLIAVVHNSYTGHPLSWAFFFAFCKSCFYFAWASWQIADSPKKTEKMTQCRRDRGYIINFGRYETGLWTLTLLMLVHVKFFLQKLFRFPRIHYTYCWSMACNGYNLYIDISVPLEKDVNTVSSELRLVANERSGNSTYYRGIHKLKISTFFLIKITLYLKINQNIVV